MPKRLSFDANTGDKFVAWLRVETLLADKVDGNRLVFQHGPLLLTHHLLSHGLVRKLNKRKPVQNILKYIVMQ